MGINLKVARSFITSKSQYRQVTLLWAIARWVSRLSCHRMSSSYRVRVNGSEPLWFVLDTGAPGTVLDASRAKMLGIKVSGGGDIEGTGESSAAAGMAKDVAFSLKGLD